MSSVFVANFGYKNGIHTWRVNGKKEDLEHLITEMEKENAAFFSPPKIEHIRNRNYTVLLELLIIKEGVLSGSYNKDPNTDDENAL